MARPKAKPDILNWSSQASGLIFGFCPAGTIPGHNEHEIARLRVETPGGEWVVSRMWPAAIVSKNLGAFAAQFWIDGRTNNQPSRATFDEIAEWINLTRSLANRLPYGGSVQAQMLDAADRLERLQAFPSHFYAKPPRGPVEEADFRFNMLIWAMNEIRKAGRYSAEGFWAENLSDRLAHLGDERQSLDVSAIGKRVERFSKTLLEGAAPRIMAETLHNVTTFGILNSDGSLNPDRPRIRAVEKTTR